MNNPQPRLSWSEYAQPRSWPLPIKLVAVVAVPALFAITVGALRVLDQSDLAGDFDRVDRVATLQEQYSELTTDLQDERDQAVLFVAVRDRLNSTPFDEATAETDKARTEATTRLGNQSDLNSGTVGALRQVDTTFVRLAQLRRQVITGTNDATDLVTQYNVIVEPLLVFNRALNQQLSNPEIGGLPQAIGALVEAREQVAAQQSLVRAVLDGGTLLDPQADALRAADGRLLTATNTVRSVLSTEQQAAYTGFAGSVAATREQLKQFVLERGRLKLPLDVDPVAWNAASVAVLQQIDAAEQGARSEVRAISASQQEAASNRAGISSVFLLLAILLGAGIVYLVAKALIGSLRTLRMAALDVAERGLPEAVQSMREGAVPDIDVTPVPVTTREEIGQVARAFDAVHSQAVRLAAEQATLQSNVSSMFANLSRRSQALAERQLKLIEQLESNEQDPDQLSNLFQLDSLATRMRRNSENLLVLSGTDLSKRASQPVPVVDVLRAAVSEVEQYQRVVVQSPPDATIAGRAASDIVHLLAELVDNATNFSAPDTQVVMSSQRTSDGSVLIEIVDRGVGMGGEDLDDANQRLAQPTALDVSVSRRMGLFVVGRLAARHGLGVRLGNPATGTTASVTVPAYLVTAGPGAGPLGGGTGLSPIPPAGIGLGTPPGREFVPTPRGGLNGMDRPAPLSMLVAGSDAPIGSPGGPLPGTPTRQPTGMGMPLPPAPVNGAPSAAAPGSNGTRSAGWPEPADNRTTTGTPAEPDAESLPTRQPGQLLGQAPLAAPPSPPAPAVQPTSEQPRPTAPEPADNRYLRPQPAVEQSGPHRPVSRPAPIPSPSQSPEPAPATEAFAVQPPASARPAPAQPASAQAPANGQSAQGGPAVQLGRPQPRAGHPQPAPSQQSQPLPARPAPQARPAQPIRSQAETSAPSLPIRQPMQNRQAAPPQSSADQPKAAPRPSTRPADRSVPPPAPQPPATPRPTPSPVTARRDEAPQPTSLFTPAAPAGSDIPATNVGSRSPGSTAEPTETTPIFEEIASAWFREDRAVPLSYDEPAAGPSAPSPARRPILPTRSAAPVPRPGATVSPTSSGPVPAAAPPASAPEPPREPTGPQPRSAPRPVPVASAGIAAPSAFSTAADDGWRASAAAAEATGDELTPAGLPKRRPRARLVPGAAGTPAGPPAAATPPMTATRTAENIRGRLSSYQDGVRQGREIRMRREAAASGNGHPTGNRNEENT